MYPSYGFENLGVNISVGFAFLNGWEKLFCCGAHLYKCNLFLLCLILRPQKDAVFQKKISNWWPFFLHLSFFAIVFSLISADAQLSRTPLLIPSFIQYWNTDSLHASLTKISDKTYCWGFPMLFRSDWSDLNQKIESLTQQGNTFLPHLNVYGNYTDTHSTSTQAEKMIWKSLLCCADLHLVPPSTRKTKRLGLFAVVVLPLRLLPPLCYFPLLESLRQTPRLPAPATKALPVTCYQLRKHPAIIRSHIYSKSINSDFFSQGFNCHNSGMLNSKSKCKALLKQLTSTVYQVSHSFQA